MRHRGAASFSATHRSFLIGDGSADMPSVPQSSSSLGERAESARRACVLSNGRAARTVAGRAIDAQDCRLLLEMLGLAISDPGPCGPADI